MIEKAAFKRKRVTEGELKKEKKERKYQKIRNKERLQQKEKSAAALHTVRTSISLLLSEYYNHNLKS